jgi:hypothetical protein
MRWGLAATAALPLLPFAYLWSLMRKLRRAGRPDVGGERMLLAWLATVLLLAATAAAFPDMPDWSRPLIVLPTLLVSFGFLAGRIRQHPTALFDPSTVHHFTRCRGHR